MAFDVRHADGGERVNMTVDASGFRHIAAHPNNERDSVLVSLGGGDVHVMVSLTVDEASALGHHLLHLASALRPIEVGVV